MARISSRKIGSRNGRAARIMRAGFLVEKMGVVFSGESLILNFSDGERSYTVVMDDEDTDKLRKRFAEHDASKAAA